MAVAIRGTTPATDTDVASPTLSIALTGSRQPQTDDVLVIIHASGFFAITNMPTPTVGGSTTNVVAATSADAGASQAHVKAYTRVITSTGDVTVAVTETGTADEEKALIVYVLSGVDTTTPVDVAGGVATAAGGSAVLTAPSISPTSSDAYLICHVNNGPASAGSSLLPPGGMAETYDVLIGGLMLIGGASLQLSASGATGTKTFAVSVTPAHVGISIAIKTAAGGAPAPSRDIPGRRIYVLP